MNRASEIEYNLKQTKDIIESTALRANRDPSGINLVVVTKTFEKEDIQILYDLGERNFGENRDQEASKKAEGLPRDINWHFQGQIQSNKLKSICDWASYIHSVDKYKYAEIISENSMQNPMPIFIQVSLDSPPQSRGGVDPMGLIELAERISKLPGVVIKGLMAVAPLEEDESSTFKRLQLIHKDFLQDFPTANYLSAGMSGDYQTAIMHGATHLRIGSSILGKRIPR